MSILKWSEKYETGVARFDAEHQNLIERFNSLYEAVFECETLEAEHLLTAEVLQDLLDYIKTHFSGEEELMLEYQYPGYEEHKKEHQSFIEEVASLQRQHQGGELALSFPLFNFLKGWIEEHIMVVDKRYGEFFQMRIK